MYNGNTRNRGKTEKGAQKIFEEIIAEKFPIFDEKTLIYTSKKFTKVQVGQRKEDPYPDTSKLKC